MTLIPIPIRHSLSQTTTDVSNDDGGKSGSDSPGSDGSSVKNLMVERLRHLSHLSTITENQNSPYSTNPGSRKVSFTLFSLLSIERCSYLLFCLQEKLSSELSDC